MAISITYHCPVCGAELTAPLLSPPRTLNVTCRGCQRSVRQPKGLIIKGWKFCLFYYGLIPIWLFLFLVDPLNWRKERAFWLTCTVAAFFGSALLAVTVGEVIGRIVARRLGAH
jgi:hypothetical protein